MCQNIESMKVQIMKMLLIKIVLTFVGIGLTHAIPVSKCLNDQPVDGLKTPWDLRPHYCGLRDPDVLEFDNEDKLQYYRELERQIGYIYDHTLEYGSGDLEELRKWHYQFDFLPKIDHAKREEDMHRHMQLFAAAFQFMKSVQHLYDIQKFPSQFNALKAQALKLLCQIENNPSIEWEEIKKEELDQFLCQFRLGDKDERKNKENQSDRNARFTQMLFRQYLLGLRAQIISKVVSLENSQ